MRLTLIASLAGVALGTIVQLASTALNAPRHVHALADYPSAVEGSVAPMPHLVALEGHASREHNRHVAHAPRAPHHTASLWTCGPWTPLIGVPLGIPRPAYGNVQICTWEHSS